METALSTLAAMPRGAVRSYNGRLVWRVSDNNYAVGERQINVRSPSFVSREQAARWLSRRPETGEED